MVIKKWLLIASLLFSSNLLAYEKDLAICTIFYNEARYLKEWIEFHKLQGVEHFYLYNNSSDDNFLTVLNEYIKGGQVTLIEWPGPCGDSWHLATQCKAYDHCIKSASGRVKWLALIDTDEFLLCPSGMDLREYLKGFEKKRKVAGVCVNWQCFGTSGVKNLNKGELLIEKLLFQAPHKDHPNQLVKSIVRPERTKRVHSAHEGHYWRKCCAVDSNLKPVVGAVNNDVPINDIRINHYFHRTMDYAYSVKLLRYKFWLNFTEEEAFQYLSRMDKNCSVEKNTDILIYAERLRKAMGF